ncbi:hypothetical protein CEP88_05735 [Roseobacter denitrificans]|uniref:hypothetical protein n=1 Tax=Roseobacter denitrificans TaxID=2434 RepID=UPI0002ED32EB|nr:hypothetical protein [Roseobacter denitrificans]AVL54794.1 hypothetical protein CEP88_05735 [Roseobacter denitrificans]SFF94152.1 hypothetical protein SAMN05443635_104138 [Roseobacter denitrificans OCh 114]
MGIQKYRDHNYRSAEQRMRHLPFNLTPPPGPEGAVIAAAQGAAHSRIAVYYDHASPPPEITISRSAGLVQTVLADGIAVAIVAGAKEPDLHKEDVVLIARYTASG